MPPVFGPRSSSNTVLWSWATPSATAACPSVSANREASSPSMNSSTTTASPAAPNRRSSRHAPRARSASARVRHTMAPLPAARPSAFTTRGAPSSWQNARAGPASRNTAKRAVGTPCRAISSLANAFELSRRAAPAAGPNTRSPAARNRSARPRASGRSGPTTVRSTRSRTARARRSSIGVVPDRHAGGVAGDPRVPGRRQHRAEPRAPRHRPGQGVLAATAAHEQDLHSSSPSAPPGSVRCERAIPAHGLSGSRWR